MKFIKEHWPLFIIILLGLVPLIWFKDGYIVAGGDSYIYLDPSKNIYHYSYSWFDKLDSGMPSSAKPTLFPFSFFWLVLKKIGFSLVNIQRVWTVFHFMFPGVFMYLLIRFLYKPPDKGKYAALAGSVLYMFNYLVITDAFQIATRPISVFLPLMLLLWIKGLSQSRFSLKYSSAIALVSLLYGTANINVAFVGALYIVLFIYFLYFILTTKRYKHAFSFAFLSVFFIFLVNLWWLTDFYFSSIKINQEIIGVVRSYNFLGATPISEAFRTMGFWAFRTMNGNFPLVPFAHFFYQPPLLFMTFMIPLLGLASLLFISRNKIKVFFIFLALLGVFLSKGTNPPFGFIYQYFYDKIPGFSAYREPFAKFTIISVFAFSVLIGFFCGDFIKYLREKTKGTLAPALFLTILIFTFLANSYPLILGENIQSKEWYQDTRVSLFVKVPDYWRKAEDWFKKNNSTAKVLLFPKTHYSQKYNWELGMATGDPVAVQFLPNPLIRNTDNIFNNENRLVRLIYQLLYLGEKVNLFPYFDLFDVDFVLQQNDIVPEDDTGVFNPAIMAKILDSQKSLKPVITFGQLNFKPVDGLEALKVYSVSRDYPLKQIYLPEEVIYVFGKLESFPDIFSFFQYGGNESYYFLDDQGVVSDQLSQIASKFLINLKNKRVVGKTDADFLYQFSVPRNANYKLLINEYLFESASKTGGEKEYYLSFNNKNVVPSAVVGGWQLVDLGSVNKGEQEIQTNLPVNEIPENYLTSPFWLIEDTVLEKQDPSFSGEGILSYKKINPSKYTVDITGVKKPFVLVLGQTYHREWKIYFNNKIIKADHFLINGYANGWYVEPSLFASGENFTFDLVYRPQKFADVGNAISLVVIFLLLFNLILIMTKEKANSRKERV